MASARTPGLRVGWLSAALVLVVGLAGCGSHACADRYGGLPSWLPTSTVAAHHVVRASAARPQVGVEGDTIEVILAQGSARATVVGPYGTVQGQYPVPETTPCTMVMTLSARRGTVAVRAGDFTFVDEMGNVHHPQVTAGSTSTAPPGEEQVSIHDVLPTGAGQLRWAPNGSTIATWDFSVEID